MVAPILTKYFIRQKQPILTKPNEAKEVHCLDHQQVKEMFTIGDSKRLQKKEANFLFNKYQRGERIRVKPVSIREV